MTKVYTAFEKDSIDIRRMMSDSGIYTNEQRLMEFARQISDAASWPFFDNRLVAEEAKKMRNGPVARLMQADKPYKITVVTDFEEHIPAVLAETSHDHLFAVINKDGDPEDRIERFKQYCQERNKPELMGIVLV